MAMASTANADFDPDAYPRHETCALCHGLFGESHSSKFPHLAGQDALYLETQLRAFIAGARTNDYGQMAAIVTELQPGDIEQVVAWFSEQPAPQPDPAEAPIAGDEAFSDLGCMGCHDTAAQAGTPKLRAQHAEYLIKQMQDFRDGRRSHSPVAETHHDLLQVSDTEITQIAAYLAAQERPE